MRNHFLKELEELKSSFIDMHSKASNIVNLALKSLEERDISLAKEVIALDDEVDALEEDIERRCMILIALQQPTAGDLKVIGTILRLIQDVERIADNGVNIANLTLDMDSKKSNKLFTNAYPMRDMVLDMMCKSKDAFTNNNSYLAKNIVEMDDAVDNIYERILSEAQIDLKEDRADSNYVFSLLLLIRYLERIADHITNICERISN